MKTLLSAEAKTHFSSVLKDVEAGNEIGILYGKSKRTVAVIVPFDQWKMSKKRQLGTLEGKMSAVFSGNWEISDEELINL